MDRLPITPQPDGRLTVEYMETVENRLALLDGDVFAMADAPSSGPVVLLVRRSDFRRAGTTWRAPARLAFATR